MKVLVFEEEPVNGVILNALAELSQGLDLQVTDASNNPRMIQSCLEGDELGQYELIITTLDINVGQVLATVAKHLHGLPIIGVTDSNWMNTANMRIIQKPMFSLPDFNQAVKDFYAPTNPKPPRELTGREVLRLPWRAAA